MGRPLREFDVDEEVLALLHERASRNGRSLTDELRVLAEAAEREDRATGTAFAEAAARFRRQLEGRPHTPSDILQREGRDER